MGDPVGVWTPGARAGPIRQAGSWVYEPIDQDPFPDYDTEAVLFYANA